MQVGDRVRIVAEAGHYLKLGSTAYVTKVHGTVGGTIIDAQGVPGDRADWLDGAYRPIVQILFPQDYEVLA